MTLPPLWPLLALDLSTTRTGWCLMAAPDAWRAGSWDCGRGDLTARLARLGAHLTAALPDWRPARVVVELPDHHAHSMRNDPATLRALYAAWGVVLETCRAPAIPCAWRSSHLVRERLCGATNANKTHVQWTLHHRGYEPPLLAGAVDHDAADAIALAVVVADEAALMARITE